MQTLLTDIELDIQELKCLMDIFSREPNAVLRGVLRRNIQQMRTRLDALLVQLEAVPALPSAVHTTGAVHSSNNVQPPKEVCSASCEEPPKVAPACLEVSILKEEKDVEPQTVEERPVNTPTSILAERIKTAKELCQSISLNDTFRFSRELFDNDSDRMNRVLHQIGEMSSYHAALSFLNSKVQVSEENEAMVDLQELLKKFFN